MSISYKYVPGEDNPADIATKGANIDCLSKTDSWWGGPKWLSKTPDHWPRQEIGEGDNVIDDTDEGTDNVLNFLVYDANSTVEPPYKIDENRFSSLRKLLRVSAYCYHFTSKLKGTNIHKNNLSLEEIDHVNQLWEIYTQQKHYKD